MTPDSLRVLLQVALRNIIGHKLKSLIVGAILLFGTFIVVIGLAMLDSVERTMARSITSSMAGHLQIYAADSDDKLSLFGQMGSAEQNLGELENFGEIRDAIEALPNVEAVVPMGLGTAMALTGNVIDRTLDQMRRAHRAGRAEEIDALSSQLRQIAAVIEEDMERRARFSADRQKLEEGRALLARVQTDAFWDTLEGDFEPTMQLLETQLAPLSPDGRIIFVRYLGTDLEQFAASFDRFKLVEGQRPPPGQRGLMLNRRLYEKWAKNKVARDLDAIYEQVVEEGKAIDTDELLGQQVDRLSRQYQRLLMQLDPEEIRQLRPLLAAELGLEGQEASEASMDELLQRFLRVGDDNFLRRHEIFYDEIAPRIRLHDLQVGDVVTLRAQTRRGYVRSVNVPLWGVFAFEGMEDSDLAGAANLLDIMTFRELYGKMTEAQREELEEIREAVGVEEIPRGEAEDVMFGGGGGDEEMFGASGGIVEEVEESEGADFDEFAGVEIPESAARQLGGTRRARQFDEEDIDRGFVLNAAILLRDPERLEETAAAIEAVSQRQELGLEVLDWKEATGLVGQFVLVMQIVLVVMIVIIFLVALVILNNAMVMATLERTQEIGTLRAIGAPRKFVLMMLILETMMLGALAGALGVALAVALLEVLGQVGLPANNEALELLFGGSHLYPRWDAEHVLWALAVVAVVSVLAVLYPARLATRIQPVVAMQSGE